MDTVVLSDLHLSDAEPVSARRPLWKAYKRREMFFDDDFCRLLMHVEAQAEGPVELILNGDTFDFDNIMRIPRSRQRGLHWLSRLRGLGSEEWMSRFKMDCIIRDHQRWFASLGEFANRGNRVVFVIGNHDLELYWPSVQRRIIEAMGLGSDVDPADETSPVLFCNWFYVSEGDTYVSHGHQYDAYCCIRDPIHPMIRSRERPIVRIPFGDLAERYLLNGMGYFNPHATSNYIMSLREYVGFFLRYMLRTQPLLLWTWFWGALVTFVMSMLHFLRPPVRDPLTLEAEVDSIARVSQVPPAMVRELNAIHEPSACAHPLRILRELWLDRALLLLAIFYGAWQIILTINFVWPISPWWFLIPVVLCTPGYFIYAFSINSSVFKSPLLNSRLAELITKITGCELIVFGHNHEPEHRQVEDAQYFNSGFWSPAYAEPECINRIGTQTFVWIRSESADGGRVGHLLEWPPGGCVPRSLIP